MEHVTELKKKITTFIELYKAQKEECASLKKECQSLKEANTKLENLLLKEHGTVDGLIKEKDAIKVAIENLIESIDKIASTKH